jgi:hypothetical protein
MFLQAFIQNQYFSLQPTWYTFSAAKIIFKLLRLKYFLYFPEKCFLFSAAKRFSFSAAEKNGSSSPQAEVVSSQEKPVKTLYHF